MSEQSDGRLSDLRVGTDDNELTLREIAEALPDTSTIMKRVGECWWHFLYAARGGNWGLAEYYLRRLWKLEEALKVLRPKHRERLERFQVGVLPAVIAAVEARDLGRLEVAFATATDEANRLHEESGYPYIRWTLPGEPPKGLDLGPVTSTDRLHAAEQPASTDGKRTRVGG
jgi:hypothetical protein